MNKYKLFSTENPTTEQFFISDSEPTTCPDGGTLDSQSVVIVKSGVLVNDGTPTDLTLADYKKLRYNEIDGKSMALIDTGFTHDSKVFSLSSFAQLNWHTLMNQTAQFTFPKDVSLKNNSKHSLTEANVSVLWADGKAFIESVIDGGRNLKQSIFDAVDESAVDAIIDNR